MKRFITLLILITIALLVVGCGSEYVQDNTDVILTPTQMEHDPMSFGGQISVGGVVGNYGRFNFSLSSEDGNFELAIDYRGNQALPAIGTVIVANGQMNYRSCCGPHLISTRFEVVE